MWTPETVLACALMLLSRGADSFPPVQFVATRPPHVSAAAEAFVVTGEPRIFLMMTSAAFVQASRARDRCGERQALRKVASILAHEEWHVRHGRDEAGAYEAQLTTLASMGAGPGNPLYDEVRRAMRAATRSPRPPPRPPAAALSDGSGTARQLPTAAGRR